MTNLASRDPLGQKPPKAVRGTSAAKAHMARVAACRCVACGRPGPSEVHHCICGRFGSRKASDFDTIPLCYECHRGRRGIHSGKESWVAANGPDTDFLALTADLINGEYNGLA